MLLLYTFNRSEKMFLCYQDNETRSNTPFNPHRYNPNNVICNHLENYFFLKFIIQNSQDMLERHRASKELDICERKIAYWKKMPTFNEDTYMRDLNVYKKNYNMC